MARGSEEDRSARREGTANDIVFFGANVTQLAQMFGMAQETVRRNIAVGGIAPVGERRGVSVYKVAEVAPYLQKPAWSEEQWTRILTKYHLPNQLTKDFWNGKRAKQLYMMAAGELWHTDDVIDALSEVLKTVSMSLKLIADNVDREVNLTQRQREIINGLADDTLLSAREALIEQFSKRLRGERRARIHELDGGFVEGGKQGRWAAEDDEDDDL